MFKTATESQFRSIIETAISDISTTAYWTNSDSVLFGPCDSEVLRIKEAKNRLENGEGIYLVASIQESWIRIGYWLDDISMIGDEVVAFEIGDDFSRGLAKEMMDLRDNVSSRRSEKCCFYKYQGLLVLGLDDKMSKELLSTILTQIDLVNI